MVIIASLGIIASILMFYHTDTRWKVGTEIQVRIKTIHKFLARFILLIGFVTTLTGLLRYQDKFFTKRDYTYFTLTLVIVIFIVVIVEYGHFLRT